MLIRISFGNGCKFAVDPLIIPIICIAIIAGSIKEYAIITFSMLLHELGHICMALRLGRAVYNFNILPIGFNAGIQNNELESAGSVVIFAAGPAVNLLLFFSASLLNACFPSQSREMLFFISVNIYLSVFNLIPVVPLDGGMILREVLAGKVGMLTARKHIKRINLILSGIFLLAGFIQLLASMWNFSLILMSGFILFSFAEGETEAALMNVKNIIYRRARLIKKGIYQARDLVVIKTVQMCEVLKNMDFDRFHIVYVLDENLNILRVLTEQEIIDGILKNNVDITFAEFIEAQKQEG